MAESIAFSKTSDRKTVYDELIPQIDSLISTEPDLIANLANIAAVLKEAFGFLWVGFTWQKVVNSCSARSEDRSLYSYKFGQGVCGHAFILQRPLSSLMLTNFPAISSVVLRRDPRS